MISYILPSVERRLKLDRHCPHCGRKGGNIHSRTYIRAISDPKSCGVAQKRLKCPFCGTTWTIRSKGVSPGRQRSDRLVGLGIMLYMFGLSCRYAAYIVRALGCMGSKSTIERDVCQCAVKAQQLHAAAPPMRVRVLGVDGTGAAMAGKSAGVLFFVDVHSGQLLSLEPIQESNARLVRRHVSKVFAALKSEELRTDELSVYDRIVPQGRHKICLAHWRKSKCKRAHDLYRAAVREDRALEADSMRRLLELLRLNPRPPTVPTEVTCLVRRYINCRKGLLWKINQLLQHVERTWEKVSNDPLDPTNNATERAIGLTFKIRARSMRGFKARHKVLTHPYLANFLRGTDGRCDMRKLI